MHRDSLHREKAKREKESRMKCARSKIAMRSNESEKVSEGWVDKQVKRPKPLDKERCGGGGMWERKVGGGGGCYCFREVAGRFWTQS